MSLICLIVVSSAHKTVFDLDAIRELIKCIGLGPCERSDRVPEGKSSHTLLLAGVFRGGHEVLAKARFALDPVEKSVTLNIQVR